MWCVAELNDEYIAKMEDVLETYEKSPTIPNSPWCVWTRSRSRCTPMSGPSPRPCRDAKRDATTSMSVGARRMFSAL